MNQASNTKKPYENLHEAKWKTAIVVVVTVVALGYLFLRPVLNAQFGWKLPDLLGAEQKVAQNDGKDEVEKLDSKSSNGENQTESKSESDKNLGDGATSRPPRNISAEKPTPSKPSPSKPESNSPSLKTNSPRGPPNVGKSKSDNTKASSEPRLGLLTKTASGDFKSTAGLIYGRGSRDGTRLKHVMQHAKDDVSKPIHGVFDGTQEEILALIDQAYILAKKNSKNVTSSKQRDRTVYTIYFPKRIGYVGGQKGKQKKYPMCKELSLVLEGDRVITAYPK